ncbi:MAG: riboflavin synthase [Crocinitomicaceae bacterium]|jgi:riboflavin synthase|nr:riboflavin synthase [Crocinitomicaceae bacterium]MAW83774.1 riboflavin synthase [Crocinitomicaceae bacterium]|tara:strand:+ start:8040 stop:8624 length:585 start_codon:yes stop_codon:yes gene_type:complete
MFTGIIESIGLIKAIQKQGENYHYTVTSDISKELKIDQSVAHNGVCLTITSCNKLDHKVTAIKETIQKTNMSHWKIGQIINLERCLKIGDRLDGHMVQGHVDDTIKCSSICEEGGSWRIVFEGKNINPRLIVDKGSICINGVSLTVVKVAKDFLEVAIIPYTYENTNFKELKVNNLVNIEYDILGKYILKNIIQ